MKAAELRIGNYVNISEKVSEIQLVNFTEIHYTDVLKNYKPIPLTEEWLMKFGFYSCETNAYFTKYIYTNAKSRVKNWTVKLFNGDHTTLNSRYSTKFNLFFWDKIEIKHVHQLQNLYFALNNEELKIK